MYHYKGKPITVHADNDGGLWYYDERGNAQTVEEEGSGYIAHIVESIFLLKDDNEYYEENVIGGTE